MREVGQERKKKSGQGRNENYVSQWKWYGRMKFLEVVVSPSKATVDTMDLTEDDFTEHGKENIDYMAKRVKKTPKKVKEEIQEKKSSLLSQAVSALSEKPAETQSQSKMTEEMAFGVLVANTLARFGEREKAIAKKKRDWGS